MEARLPTHGASAKEVAVQVALSLVILTVALIPGLLLDGYLRVLSTVLFVALGLLVLRAVAAALASFKPAPTPPEKPKAVSWPTVSVLVPAYDEADVLPRTMASMRQLDYPADRLQFVYVYEASDTTRTGEIIEGFARQDDRFVAVEREADTGGKGAAANAGLDHCTGELVVSLDADHRLAPGSVERAARWFLAEPDLACVRGRCVGENGEDSYLARQVRVERDGAEKGYIYLREVLGGFTTFGGGQAVFRRSVFDELGRFDEEILVEDIDFSMRIHQAGYDLRIDPEIVTFEENPAILAAWWAQRKRWARGWMQVARRYLPVIHRSDGMSWRVKADAYYTLAYGILPVGFALFFPLAFLGVLGVQTAAYLPTGFGWMWTAFALAPIALSGAVLLQDLKQGIAHHWHEAPAYATLWLYLVAQTPVFWSAFLEEFILDRPSVYVKTPRNGLSHPAG